MSHVNTLLNCLSQEVHISCRGLDMKFHYILVTSTGKKKNIYTADIYTGFQVTAYSNKYLENVLEDRGFADHFSFLTRP